ncbi:hypothetical protein F4806DRAFT_496096 [Annulohypoxylon nitens]|nr:hypothetical protein F4806DRAFT_496096 [Annulohypoxylon nitens]
MPPNMDPWQRKWEKMDELMAVPFLSDERLDGGIDGYVWKVFFADGSGPYAVKIDPEPPEFEHHYAAQRECQNAALLQMMKAVLSKSPVLVNSEPKTKSDALDNFQAFFRE